MWPCRRPSASSSAPSRSTARARGRCPRYLTNPVPRRGLGPAGPRSDGPRRAVPACRRRGRGSSATWRASTDRIRAASASVFGWSGSSLRRCRTASPTSSSWFAARRTLGVARSSRRSRSAGLGRLRAQERLRMYAAWARSWPPTVCAKSSSSPLQARARQRVGVEGRLQVLEDQREAQDLGVLLGRGRRRGRPGPCRQCGAAGGEHGAAAHQRPAREPALRHRAPGSRCRVPPGGAASSPTIRGRARRAATRRRRGR